MYIDVVNIKMIVLAALILPNFVLCNNNCFLEICSFEDYQLYTTYMWVILKGVWSSTGPCSEWSIAVYISVVQYLQQNIYREFIVTY